MRMTSNCKYYCLLNLKPITFVKYFIVNYIRVYYNGKLNFTKLWNNYANFTENTKDR